MYEEVGELAQTVLIHRKKSSSEKYISGAESKQKLAEELAGVGGMAIVNAKLFGLDLEEAINRKWIKKGK